MRIENFLENRHILNYHCPDHRSKVFVEQQLFTICYRHNGLGKHTLYPGTKKSKNLLHSVICESVVLTVVVCGLEELKEHFTMCHQVPNVLKRFAVGLRYLLNQ